MKTPKHKTIYSILIIIGIFLGGFILVQAIDIPLNSAPYVKGTAGPIRGQSKAGRLTVGSSTPGTSQLTAVGPTGITVSRVNCTALPYIAPLSWPCPTIVATGPEAHILQMGYTYKMVIGAPSGTPPTTGAMLDVIGSIKADPVQMNYAGGSFYSGSSSRKPLCALPNGEIAVCGTAGICGADNGARLTTTPTRLCDRGDASTVRRSLSDFTWTCAVGINTPVPCSASILLSTGSGVGSPGGSVY